MLDSAEDLKEYEVGIEFVKRVVLVHLQDTKSKFDLIIFMIQKLYGMVKGDYGADNPDSLQFQETLLPGHLYLSIIKEKVSDWLGSVKLQVQMDLRKAKHTVDLLDSISLFDCRYISYEGSCKVSEEC
jgi:DNA-directed RNA polymerase I subunit RPA2